MHQVWRYQPTAAFNQPPQKLNPCFLEAVVVGLIRVLFLGLSCVLKPAVVLSHRLLDWQTSIRVAVSVRSGKDFLSLRLSDTSSSETPSQPRAHRLACSLHQADVTSPWSRLSSTGEEQRSLTTLETLCLTLRGRAYLTGSMLHFIKFEKHWKIEPDPSGPVTRAECY